MALKQLFPSGRLVSFFALVSVLGVALGVLALFGTQSVMNGFHSEISVKLVDTGGEASVMAGGRVINDGELARVIEMLRSDPRVKTVERVAAGAVMMRNGNIPAFPMLRSYDTVADESVIPFREKGFVRAGDIGELDDDSMIISYRLASQVGAGIGDSVEIYSTSMVEKYLGGEISPPVKLKITGYLNTGFSKFDDNAAIVSLRRMRDLYSLGDGYHMLAVKLKDGADPEAVVRGINSLGLPYPLKAYTWLTGNSDFLRVIITEKVMMSVIIMLIIIVASFSICSSLYTSVLRKTKEIGLQAAMGARGWEIAASYCLQGFVIGLLGAAAGLGLTFLILHFRDPIVGFVVGRETLSEFYFFSRLPVRYDFWDGFRACLFAVSLCTFAGFLPALRASRLKASEAMRNE